MKFFKDLFSHTLIYKLYSILYWLVEYIKDYNYVSETIYSEAFFTILRRYLNTDFSKDWIGRIYGVINPHIDIDGKFNFNNTIIEIDGDNTNSKLYVENWVYRQMNLVKSVFNLEHSGLFDYIGVTVNHVGPASHDNFLVVFDLVSRKEMTRYLKNSFYHMLIYAVIFALCLLGFEIYNGNVHFI